VNCKKNQIKNQNTDAIRLEKFRCTIGRTGELGHLPTFLSVLRPQLFERGLLFFPNKHENVKRKKIFVFLPCIL